VGEPVLLLDVALLWAREGVMASVERWSAQALQQIGFVGWVERSETHHLSPKPIS
jgi:hypothetical protein